MKFQGWQHLQGRYALIGSLFTIALIGIAWIGNHVVSDINNQNITNLNQRGQVIELIPRLNMEFQILQQEAQQFLINPAYENTLTIGIQSEDILKTLATLSESDWIKQAPTRSQIISRLKDQHLSLIKEINTLMVIRANVEKWFPASSVMINKITPASDKFYASITSALENIQELDRTPTQYKINKLLSDLYATWSRMISTYRLQVLNRFSIFGGAEQSMTVHEYNIELYLNIIDEAINQLAELENQGALEFEIENAMENIRLANSEWREGYAEAKIILHSDAWRMDISILKNKITPAFGDIHGNILKLNEELFKSSQNEIKLISYLASNLSNSLLIIALSAIVLSVLGFFILQRYLLKPITNITNALKSFAAGEKTEVTASTNLQEIDNLISAFSEMKRQIRIRQNKLELSRDQANEANEIKSRFLARMSHELRTPLNAIIGFSELAMEQMEQEANNPYIDDIRDVHTAGKHLLTLVNDILDFSHAEAGNMELQLGEIDISTLIGSISETSETYLTHTNNTLNIILPENTGSMYSDANKVSCILLNLFNNACKFTHNGRITLQVTRDKIDNDEYVIFTIADTGIGMDREQMDKLFVAFVQGDESFTRKYGGIGLGLALCMEYTYLLGGVLCVDSELGEGSRFSVYLPEITSIDTKAVKHENHAREII